MLDAHRLAIRLLEQNAEIDESVAHDFSSTRPAFAADLREKAESYRAAADHLRALQ